jgi:hypothetical protein
VTYSLRKFVLLSSLLSALSWAQVDTGAITGTVKDPSGGIVAKAVVKIDSSTVGSTISLLTNNSGLYSQPGLKPGVYSISASAPGFNTVTKTGIEVRVQDRVAVDFDFRSEPLQVRSPLNLRCPQLKRKRLLWVRLSRRGQLRTSL